MFLRILSGVPFAMVSLGLWQDRLVRYRWSTASNFLYRSVSASNRVRVQSHDEAWNSSSDPQGDPYFGDHVGCDHEGSTWMP